MTNSNTGGMALCEHEYYFWSSREQKHNDPSNLWTPDSYWVTKNYRGCKKCGTAEEITVAEAVISEKHRREGKDER